VAFVVDPAKQAGLPVERCCGFLLHEFGEDAVATRLVIPHGMERPYIHEVSAAAYLEALKE
jgi:hypothetical protein